MNRFHFKSIQHRLMVLLLIPVAGLLLLAGFSGYFFSRNVLLKYWEASANLKVERAARSIDTRLSEIIGWMKMFHRSGQSANQKIVQQWIVQQLEAKQGVTQVKILINAETAGQETPFRVPSMHLHDGKNGGLHFHHGQIVKLTSPETNNQTDEETISIYSSLADTAGREIGKLWVQVRFDYLLQDLLEFGWWQSERAFLVDNSGRYPSIEIGVGLNYGKVVVGNIGSEERAKYGIVGSAVNATERIQRFAEGGQVVISESLKSLLGDRVEIEKQFTKTLKGFNIPITLYVVGAYRE